MLEWLLLLSADVWAESDGGRTLLWGICLLLRQSRRRSLGLFPRGWSRDFQCRRLGHRVDPSLS